MGSAQFTSHFSLLLLLSFFSLLSLAERNLNLNLQPSDSDALRQVMRGLGSNGQDFSCHSSGISCERRVSRNSSEFRVTRIMLKSQRLSGFLSPMIGRLSELKELSLPNNHLLHQIPPQLGNCRKLEILILRSNRFSGPVPPELSTLVNIKILDLSSNQFSGDLGFLKNLRKVENLSISENLFVGKIPAFLGSFQNLRFLNLTGNRLESTTPEIKLKHSTSDAEQSIGTLPRRYRLAESPHNSQKSKNDSSAPSPSPSGKSSGSGVSLSPAPSPSLATNKKRKHHPRHTRILLLGFFTGAIAGILSGVLFSAVFRLLLTCIRRRGKKGGPDIFSPLMRTEDLAFLEKEDGLSTLELIGRGGCGEVYKAELPELKPGTQRRVIAIKKITPPVTDGSSDLNEEDTKLLNKRMRQIRSEIKTVGHIRHRNLLPLLAHVARPECHYLVYDFMKNGSLQDVLNQVSTGTRELDWPTRHKIAIGIAAGLEYLHMHHIPCIIHRDLKPGNILLDDDLEAKISDFGLAKAVPENKTHVTSSNCAGTLGFIAPEYHQTMKFTDKCDIFSFGVVLASLVTGKCPSDQFFQTAEDMIMVKWLKSVMASDNPEKAIDPKLIGKNFEEQMLLVLKIACFCTQDDPKKRPNSKEVRSMLSQVNNSTT